MLRVIFGKRLNCVLPSGDMIISHNLAIDRARGTPLICVVQKLITVDTNLLPFICFIKQNDLTRNQDTILGLINTFLQSL